MKLFGVLFILVGFLVCSPAVYGQYLSSQIKNIRVFGENSGLAITDFAAYRTDDDGQTWNELNVPKNFNETIGDVYFIDEHTAWLALSSSSSLRVFKSEDGGASWLPSGLDIDQGDLEEGALSNVEF